MPVGATGSGIRGMRSKRRRNLFRQGSFYLCAQMLGGGHRQDLRLIFAYCVVVHVKPKLWEKSGYVSSSK